MKKRINRTNINSRKNTNRRARRTKRRKGPKRRKNTRRNVGSRRNTRRKVRSRRNTRRKVRSRLNTRRKGGASSQDNPVCVMTFGPTGAGKSHLHESAMLVLNGEVPGFEVVPSAWKMILIDDIVAGGEGVVPSVTYREKLEEIFNEVLEGNQDNVEERLVRLFTKPRASELKLFSNAYYAARKGNPCRPHAKDTNCDGYNDKRLTDAVSRGENVVIEMMGTYKPEWVYDILSKAPVEYSVVLAVSCVNSIDALIKRNLVRAEETARGLLNSEGGLTTLDDVKRKLKMIPSLPRLPDIIFDHYKGLCETIHRTVEDCIRGRVLGGWNPHIVLVDNTKYASNYTALERVEHWMASAVSAYNKGDDKVPPSLMMPALGVGVEEYGEIQREVISWMGKQTNTIFLVHDEEKPQGELLGTDDEGVTVKEVLEEHQEKVNEVEDRSKWGVVRDVIGAANALNAAVAPPIEEA